MPSSYKPNGARSSYSKGAARGPHPGNFDGRLAYNIVEAAQVLRTVKRLDSQDRADKLRRAKVAAVSLAKMPWD